MSEVSFALSAKLKSTQQMINLRIIFLGLADLWIPCPAKKGWVIVSRFWEVASFSLTFLCSSALLFELRRQTVLERKVLWTTSSLSFRKMGCMGCLSKQPIGFTLRQGTLVLTARPWNWFSKESPTNYALHVLWRQLQWEGFLSLWCGVLFVLGANGVLVAAVPTLNKYFEGVDLFR